MVGEVDSTLRIEPVTFILRAGRLTVPHAYPLHILLGEVLWAWACGARALLAVRNALLLCIEDKACISEA